MVNRNVGATDRKVKTNIRLPSVSIPRGATGSRNPPGWGATEINLRGAGAAGVSNLRKPEPAGDPPPEFTGTRPEWAIWWALEKLGKLPGEDFSYEARQPGVGASGQAQVDFLIHSVSIAIEVQGRFWHYGQGSKKVTNDILRVSEFARQGIKVIFIDEPDALSDPIYYVKEALEGNDHSHVNRMRSASQI